MVLKNQITVMALITLVACIASEAIPLCPHVNSTPPQVVLLMLLLPMQQEHCILYVSQAIPISFCSTNLFQYQDAEGLET